MNKLLHIALVTAKTKVSTGTFNPKATGTYRDHNQQKQDKKSEKKRRRIYELLLIKS